MCLISYQKSKRSRCFIVSVHRHRPPPLQVGLRSCVLLVNCQGSKSAAKYSLQQIKKITHDLYPHLLISTLAYNTDKIYISLHFNCLRFAVILSKTVNRLMKPCLEIFKEQCNSLYQPTLLSFIQTNSQALLAGNCPSETGFQGTLPMITS